MERILGIIGITLLVLLFVAIIRENVMQSSTKNNIILDIKYCSGQRDTLNVEIIGTVSSLHIDNYKTAVPELRSYYDVVVYNVCWFNVIEK